MSEIVNRSGEPINLPDLEVKSTWNPVPGNVSYWPSPPVIDVTDLLDADLADLMRNQYRSEEMNTVMLIQILRELKKR